jgi:2-polyprenyl-3-methyl-5-hydroxy-6-metoxy-1,4-benzoquinol methylase
VGPAWNHNTIYHQALIRRLPTNPRRALDVGCGDGRFARLLAQSVHEVVAIDVDRREVDRARAAEGGPDNVQWQCADLLTYAVDGSYDVVTALAVVHHLPLEQALAQMERLLRPGGRLLVLGVWPARATMLDTATSAVAVVVNALLQLRYGRTRMASPAQQPSMSLSEARARSQRQLPGATVRRRLLWRFILEWTKPAD